MKEKNVRVNKYPFFLWITAKRKLDIDMESLTVKSDIGISKVKKVETWKILLMKYLPFLILLLNGTLPSNKQDGIIFLISFAIVVLSIAIFVKLKNLFIWYLLALIVLGNYFIYSNLSNAVYIDMLVLYVAELILFMLIALDIAFKKYENYYHLIDVKKITNVNIAQKHNRPILPLWGKRGLFKVERGFNWGFNYSIGGYYIRITNEEVKNEI